MVLLLTGRRAIGPVGKNFCHATIFSVILKADFMYLSESCSEEKLFFFGSNAITLTLPLQDEGLRQLPTDHISKRDNP